MKVLSFGGTTTKQAAITNAILGQATFRVLISAFDLTGGGGMHPLALLAMTKMQGPEGSGDGFEGMMKMMAMGQMLQGGGNMFGNMFQQPAGQPVIQQPTDQPAAQQSAVPGTFAGMFPGFMQPVVQQTPVQQPAEPQPAAPQPMNTAEIIEALLKDPETRNMLKEALKD